MKPTWTGGGVLVMAGLTLLTAASTGNNLLYLVWGILAATLGASFFLCRWNLARISVAVKPPEQVFRDQPFNLAVAVSGHAYGVELRWQGSQARVEHVDAEGVSATLRGALPHRGLNLLDDLAVSSKYPFGLFECRRGVAATVLALPRPAPVREPREVSSAAHASGRPTLRKGSSGEELYGIRDFAPGDDARILNWKLSARLGRPLVNEYCSAHDDKITVRVSGGRGEGAEKAVEQAASACRYYVDAGVEVRLETGEETIDYGRGLGHLDKLLAALARVGDGREARPTAAAARAKEEAAEPPPALRRLTLAGIWLVFAGMPLVDEISQKLLLLSAPVLLLGAVVQEKRFQVLPRLAWNALSLLVLAYTLLVDWRVEGLTVANTHLLIYLLINRALTPFKKEELGQIFMICFLAFFLTSGLTISLWYFVLFLAYLAHAGLWLSVNAGSPWEGRARWLGGLGRVAAATVLTALVLFAATPRVEGLRRINPFLAAGIDKLAVQKESVVGFSENVSLGFFGRLKKSSARVMRVRPVPAPATDKTPAQVYVRGASFDGFNGRNWFRSERRFAFTFNGRHYNSLHGRVWAERAGDQMSFPARAAPRGGPVHEFTIYPMNLAVVFTVGTPAFIEGAPTIAGFDHGDGVQFAAPYQGGVAYKSHQSVDAGFAALGRGYESRLAPFLAVPPDPSGRVAALAREITAGVADPAEKAQVVEAYLRKRYGYSLYSEGKDTSLEDFLFKTRKGNCEYFATAGAVLLRHAGVPTRLVTGFLASDWNDYGKFFDVRQGEAHAWLEAYIPGHGWARADPTPGQSAFAAGFEEIGRKASHWLSALEAQWYRHVIGYDQYVQRNTFHRLGTALSPQLLRRLARGAGALICLGALAAGLLQGLRRWRARGGPPPTILRRAEEALSGAGLSREPHWTAREYASSVAGKRPELAALSELAELHYLDRYRPGGLAAPEKARAERLLGALAAAALTK